MAICKLIRRKRLSTLSRRTRERIDLDSHGDLPNGCGKSWRGLTTSLICWMRKPPTTSTSRCESVSVSSSALPRDFSSYGVSWPLPLKPLLDER